MNKCDLDNDGKIDYLEFMQAAINHQALLNKENISAMFKLFDTNDDGLISMQELQEVF
jgi:Ca2+-binding EF-hand superfamily protein